MEARMTKQAILQKAVEVAMARGWRGAVPNQLKEMIGHDELELVFNKDSNVFHLEWSQFIFNHDFAKALWPKKGNAKMIYSYPEQWALFRDNELVATSMLLPEWQYHLQQMVIAEDPLTYLADHLPGGRDGE